MQHDVLGRHPRRQGTRQVDAQRRRHRQAHRARHEGVGHVGCTDTERHASQRAAMGRMRIGAHHHQVGQQVAGVDALVGRIQRQARRLGVAQAVDGVDHLQRGGIDHEQHAAHVRLAAVAGHVQAVAGAVHHQLAQVVGVGGLAVLAGLLLHQLDGADGLVLRGIDHGHRQVHGVAHVQAVVGVVQHHAERLALQRDAGFHRQRSRPPDEATNTAFCFGL
ncbi:hypothetical protein G6F32_013850 [Rhizopus arrhizus]|nr:hypothetical protein G6F32_013850 [Rhizopus arrhizus]